MKDTLSREDRDWEQGVQRLLPEVCPEADFRKNRRRTGGEISATRHNLLDRMVEFVVSCQHHPGTDPVWRDEG